MNDSNKKGEIFEKYITSLYESLNFSVTTNVSIDGQQVDILAIKSIQGVGETNLIIECKFLSSGSVSNQVVHDFGAFLLNKTKYRGILITNLGFSEDAKSAAKSYNITLLTQEQLESEILHLKEPYFKNLKDFEIKDIFTEYIPQLGSLNNKKEVINIEETILGYSWNDWKKISFITILADYGAGKSTLLQRLNYIFSKKYLEGNSIKPIYFELKNFYKYNDLDSFIQNRMNKVFQKDLPIDLIWKSIDQGDFLILLDGFDEMSPQVNASIRNENFMKLAPLLLSNSNTIITCRPSYFISKSDYESAVSNLMRKNIPPKLGYSRKKELKLRGLQESIYKNLTNKYTEDISIQTESKKVGAINNTITISDFNDIQIDTYLENFNQNFEAQCNTSWLNIKAFLIGIYDIKSLLKKPILLSMIKDTMLDLGVNYNKNNDLYDPASLYEIYTNANISRDWSKGVTRQFLSSEKRLTFAEILAHQMFVQDNLEVHYGQITALIEKNISLFSNIGIYTVEEIASDIQICSFIKRTEDDTFRFIHKSFMEFFVAKKFKNEYYKKKRNELYTKLITKDILYFLGCYCTAEKTLETSFAKLASPKLVPKTNITLRRNTTIAYLLSRPEHLHLNIKNITINIIDLNSINFKHCNFENLKFENVSLLRLQFSWGSKINITAFDSTFDDCTFEDSLIKITLNSSYLINTRFVNCKELMVAGEKVSLNYIVVTDCENTVFEASHKMLIQKSSFQQSNIDLASPIISIESAIISSAKISIQSSNISITNSEIRDTNFLINNGISTNIKKYTNITIEKSVLRNVYFKHNYLKIKEEDTVFICCTFSLVILNTNKMTEDEIINKFIDCSGLIILNNTLEQENKYFRINDLIVVQGAKKKGFINSTIDKLKGNV